MWSKIKYVGAIMSRINPFGIYVDMDKVNIFDEPIFGKEKWMRQKCGH